MYIILHYSQYFRLNRKSSVWLLRWQDWCAKLLWFKKACENVSNKTRKCYFNKNSNNTYYKWFLSPDFTDPGSLINALAVLLSRQSMWTWHWQFQEMQRLKCFQFMWNIQSCFKTEQLPRNPSSLSKMSMESSLWAQY